MNDGAFNAGRTRLRGGGGKPSKVAKGKHDKVSQTIPKKSAKVVPVGQCGQASGTPTHEAMSANDRAKAAPDSVAAEAAARKAEEVRAAEERAAAAAAARKADDERAAEARATAAVAARKAEEERAAEERAAAAAAPRKADEESAAGERPAAAVAARKADEESAAGERAAAVAAPRKADEESAAGERDAAERAAQGAAASKMEEEMAVVDRATSERVRERKVAGEELSSATKAPTHRATGCRRRSQEMSAADFEMLDVLSSLDDRLVEQLRTGSIRLLRSTWVCQTSVRRMQRRQELEMLEQSGQLPLLSNKEAVALIRKRNRGAGALT